VSTALVTVTVTVSPSIEHDVTSGAGTQRSHVPPAVRQ
jgi:hypothetical protein